MNISQKLLFARVGFTPNALQLLCNHIEKEQINERTARRWASGEVEPRNEYYVHCAIALDKHLTAKALAVIHNHKAVVGQYDNNRIILPYYANDDEYWIETNDMPCSVSIYHQLLQRIEILSDKTVFYLNDGCLDDELRLELERDWDNYVNLSVDFDFSLSDPFTLSVDDDSDL